MLSRKRSRRSCGTDDAPTLIIVDSVIGWGSPVAGTAKAHSDPMGAEAIRETKRAYGWPEDAQFLVPPGVVDHFRGQPRRSVNAASRGVGAKLSSAIAPSIPSSPRQLDCMLEGRLPDGWDGDIPDFAPDATGIASRDAGGKVLNAIAHNMPALVGGAADLAPSTKTRLTFEGAGDLEAESHGGRNMHFGVREHAMGAIANGMALSYLRPFTATFLVFSDYMRPPIRLAAIMELPTIFVFSHDSIGVGEDGPTHQPIEQLAALRAIPGLNVIRPADANETAEAWRVAIDADQDAELHHPLAPEAADDRPRPLRLGRSAGQGRLCPGRCRRGRPRADPARHGQRGLARARRARTARRRGRPLARRLDAVAGLCSNSSRPSYRDAVLPPVGPRPRRGGAGRARSAGTAMSGPMARP